MRIARLFRGTGIVNDAGWRVKAESGQTDETARPPTDDSADTKSPNGQILDWRTDGER